MVWIPVPNRVRWLWPAAMVVLVALAAPAAGALSAAEPSFTTDFRLRDCTFTSRGQSLYYVLQPGHQLVLAGDDNGTATETIITVLNQTRRVGGVETRVIEERHSEDGELVEISRNFFAICRQTQSLFYFGEEVDMIEDGVVVGHDGAWLHGVNGARAGLMLPAQPLLGARYYQEIAPGVALDRAEVIALDEVAVTPAGRFTGVLRTRETTPLEPGAVDDKRYAPGIGLIEDGAQRLVRYRLGWGVRPPDDADDDDD
jgi:hypothetical protein